MKNDNSIIITMSDNWWWRKQKCFLSFYTKVCLFQCICFVAKPL